MVAREIRRAGYEDKVAAGVVLTGGTAMLEGLVDMAEQILELPVRKGIPMDVRGLVDVVSSPMYATGVGLIQYALKGEGQFERVQFANGHMVSKVYDRVRGWFRELF